MRNKYIYLWYDGDVKRHYFSTKANLNKWIKEFVDEIRADEIYMKHYVPHDLRNKSAKEMIKYYSSALFVERIELDL